MRTSLLLTAALLSTPAFADEGMWTFNNFPSDKVKAKYNWSPTQEWLDKVRLGSVRIAVGCSASIVSPDGLVMTNHHCAHSCIAQLSTPKKDFVKAGFYAKEAKDEVKCPEIELNQLVEITDVTKAVQDATRGVEEAKFNEIQSAVSPSPTARRRSGRGFTNGSRHGRTFRRIRSACASSARATTGASDTPSLPGCGAGAGGPLPCADTMTPWTSMGMATLSRMRRTLRRCSPA